jgi:outer membrane receptor protein involved in Fe transport
MRANPVKFRNHLNNDLGLFAQDRWSLKRTTLNLAIRYDHFNASFPEQTVGPAEFAPTRNFVFPRRTT